jgi:hypothetical protein
MGDILDLQQQINDLQRQIEAIVNILDNHDLLSEEKEQEVTD